MIRCSDDNSFGPVLGPGSACEAFDFTLRFEEAFLSIVPSVGLSVILLLHLVGTRKRAIQIQWPFGLTLKLAIYAIVNVLQICLVALWAADSTQRTRLTLASATFALASTIILAVVSCREHCHSSSPCAAVQVSLLLTTILDIARIRTQWLLPENVRIATVSSVTFGCRIVWLILESVPKHKYGCLLTKNVELPPEALSGIFSRSLFLWINPLLTLGFGKDLSMDDLYPVDDALSGPKTYQRLHSTWLTCNKDRKHALAIAVTRTFWVELGLLMLPRFAVVGFSIAQPFLVEATMNYITKHAAIPVSQGYGLVGAYALTYVGFAISSVWNMHIMFRLITMIRGALISLIYKGMLSVRAESGNAASGVALMSNDVDRITVVTAWIVNIIPCIIQVAIALWILGVQLGAVCIAPVILAIICGLLSTQVGKLVPPRQRAWMQAVQKRVGITTEVISSIKGVKMTGLTEKVTDQIQGLRNFELDESKKFRKVQISNICIGQLPSIMTPAVTFAAFAIAQQTSGGEQFGVAKAFTSLSLISILIDPVAQLVMVATQLYSALSCADRIQEFLVQERREDFRSRHNLSRYNSSFSSATSVMEDDTPRRSKSDQATGVVPFIKVRGASFGWTKDDMLLHDVTFDIHQSTLTMIVGPVGAGKSTLLNALLGETYISGGMLELNATASIAYCGQDPWVLNKSIKDNIIGAEKFDRPLYEEVVDACQLKVDFDTLQAGDKTEVGSQGSSLSGGQKQRIALARAAYSRRQVTILDDSLKGLDAGTSLRCFHSLLGQDGLLRGEDRAVILATHDVQLLSYADQILVLGQNGRVTERGTFEELQVSSDYIRSLRVHQLSNRVNNETARSRKVPSSKNAQVGLPQTAAVSANTRGHSNKNTMMYYLKSMGTVSFLIFLSLVVLQMSFRTLQPLWLKFWVAANTKNPNESIGMWIGIYIMFGALTLVFLGIEVWYYFVTVVPYSAKSLHYGLLKAAMKFSQDLTLVDLPLPIAFMMALEYLTSTISQLVLTCIASGYLAIAIPLLAAVLFFVQRVYLRTSRQMRLLDLEAKSPLYSHFISSFTGLTTIRAFAWSRQFHKENLERLTRAQQPYYLLYCLQRWLTLVLDLIIAGLATLLVGLAVALRDKIDPGLLGVALTGVIGFGQTLSLLVTQWTQLETSLGAVARIREFERDTPQEYDGPTTPPDGWPNEGAISLRQVSAAYGERTVLKNVTLDIRAGEKVAIVGRTGSGKSTLLALLLRLQAPTAGEILIDGVETGSMPLNTLRSSLVTLPQDPLFLAGTVRQNLDPFSGANDDTLLDVLRKVGIAALIEDKGGLDVDLNVDWLSAGQKQLFCLARAWLRKSKVLLLDEATSSLDYDTEKMVIQFIKNEFRDWTTIMVAHRLRTIIGFDKVVVLDEGKVREFDEPAMLLQRDSLFKALWDLHQD